MNNVHEPAPIAFESRWALSYLRGPLTRSQIKELMGSRGRSNGATATKAPRPRAAAPQRPVLPPEVAQKFIPSRVASGPILYQPVVLGAAQVRYMEAKANIDFVEDMVLAAPVRDDSLPVEWDECFPLDLDPNDLENEPAQDAAFAALPSDAAKPRCYTAWNKDLVNWIYANRKLDIYRSSAPKASSQPGESEGEFRARLQHSVREERDLALEKLRQKYATKVMTLEDRLRRAEQTVAKENEQRSASLLSVGADLFGVVFGRKKATSAIGSMSRTYKESSDIGRAQQNAEAVKRQLEDLKAQIESDAAQIQASMDASSVPVETVAIKPKKTNINVRLFTLAWAPYVKDPSGNSKPAWE